MPFGPCLYSLSPSSILILGGENVVEEFMRVIDVSTMQMSILDVALDYKKECDVFFYNQSVELHGKVYMLGQSHIHVITKDCQKYECIKEHGEYYL